MKPPTSGPLNATPDKLKLSEHGNAIRKCFQLLALSPVHTAL